MQERVGGSMKKLLSVMSVLLLVLCAITGCGGKKKDAVGKWYDEGNKCLDIRSDGTYKLEGAYGKGRWEILDKNGTIEFTDFYGDTNETVIAENDYGLYIDFDGHRRFYKDKYPSQKEIDDMNAKDASAVDPFKNLKYEVSGVSPYCEISANNQKCSEEVQNYVRYKFDKQYYKNGETAKVTAELTPNSGNLVLSKTTDNFKVEKQPAYVTELGKKDLEVLQKEVSDKINAMIAASIGHDELFGEGISYRLRETDIFKSADVLHTDELKIQNANATLDSVYITSLKKQNNTQFNANTPYNTVSFLYTVDYNTSWPVDTRQNGNQTLQIPGKIYVNICAKNVVKASDGTIYWNDESNSLDNTNSFDGIETLKSNTVMNSSDRYNISEGSIS